MIEFRVEVEGVEAVKAHLTGYMRQVKFATAKALTDTASAVKAEIPAGLERELDRPTQFTKRGVFVKPARREDLTAVVGFQLIQAGYLTYQVEGGLRSPKNKALRLPSNIKLDESGNLPRGTIKALIRAAQQGKLGKTVQRRLGEEGGKGAPGRRKGTAAGGLFYGQPRGLNWPPGLYRRVPPTVRGGKGKLIPIIVFPPKPARYRPRFKFRELAGRVINREWPVKFRQALDYALATAR